MFQILAKSFFVASRTMQAPKPCLPREADLPHLSVPRGWGSLNAPRPQSRHQTRRRVQGVPLAPCNA